MGETSALCAVGAAHRFPVSRHCAQGFSVETRIAVGAAFTSSPWAYNGKIFALSEDGNTYVIRAGREYELLGMNALDEFTMATPAIAQGSLFIRTASKLYRIREGG